MLEANQEIPEADQHGWGGIDLIKFYQQNTAPKLNLKAFLRMNPLFHIDETHFRQCL